MFIICDFLKNIDNYNLLKSIRWFLWRYSKTRNSVLDFYSSSFPLFLHVLSGYYIPCPWFQLKPRILSWISGPYILFLKRYLHLYILKLSQSPVPEMVLLSVLSSCIFSPHIPYTHSGCQVRNLWSSQARSSSSPFLPYLRVFEVIRVQSYEFFFHPYPLFHSYFYYPGSGDHLSLDHGNDSELKFSTLKF